MHTIWFPAPVVVLLRRVVNVVIPLSVSHHYLRHKPQSETESSVSSTTGSRAVLWDAFKWPTWSSKGREFSQATAAEAEQPIPVVSPLDPMNDLPIRDNHQFLPSEEPKDEIHRLMSTVLHDPVRTPRNPIALCHGLYGFDVRGPSAFPILQMHYWSNVLEILKQKVGAEVIVTSVPSTGSIASRSMSMDRVLAEKARGKSINFIAHSMGGLDCRHLITHIKPTAYRPVSLTSIATPHRGSPFMDWCKENLGLGKLRHKEHGFPAEYSMSDAASSSEKVSLLHEHEQEHSRIHARAHEHVHRPKHETLEGKARSSKSSLSSGSLPSSFTTLLLSILDSPAYANLTTSYLKNEFNPATPDDLSVKYFSVAGRVTNLSIWHPLWLPKMVLDGFEEKEREGLRGDPLCDCADAWGNDALVTVQSAKWGEFLGIMEGCDHWDLRGARGLDLDMPSVNMGIGASKPKNTGEDEGADGYGWSFADWSRFVRVWKKKEKDAAKSAGARISEKMHEDTRGHGHKRSKEHGDEVVKSSTDKLSAVFDWIIDQVPSTRSFNLLTTSSPESGSTISSAVDHASREKTRKQAERSDLATKVDLERFYVALCRKLYDEGL